MKALLVYPKNPVTYWGFQESLRFIRKRASLPPLGLATVAACVPASWSLRLVDLNVRPLEDRELLWADVVLVGGMLVQTDSIHQVLARARGLDRTTVVGGPVAITSPELFPDADVLLCGEAEGRGEELAQAVEAVVPDRQQVLPAADDFVDLSSAPVPRFDLFEMSRYASMSIQFSRGCPFLCEFCDIIEIFGRRPRVKSTAQVMAELETLYQLGYRGSVFVVDDNFVGNIPAVRELLPCLQRWQEDHGRPFELYTEASVNLAKDEVLVQQMVQAGFASVFVGIETPSPAALGSANKSQNLRIDLASAVESLTTAGLEVMGGFIVGFDGDDPDIFEAQHRFIQSCPIPLAMVGLLQALPGTALWRRLKTEQRLRERSCGDQFGRPNFEPAMDESRLLRGYSELLRRLYSPRAYYRRCRTLMQRVGKRPLAAGSWRADLLAFLQAAVRIGVLSNRRRLFWMLLLRGVRGGKRLIREAVVLAVKGEHMIRYTRRHVVPRLRAAVLAIEKS